MALRRYTAIADTTITNAYKSNLKTRGDDSNMGRSDILEIFSIYAQATTDSTEQARILIKFSDETIDELETFKNNTDFKVFLKVFNAPHSMTLPSGFTIEVARLITEWEEGHGLDMEEYSDVGALITSEYPLIFNGTGATWNVAKNGTSWTNPGGDYDAGSVKTFTFDEGYEELEIDITDYILYWAAQDSSKNKGIIIKLAEAEEGSNTTIYTKRFFARGTEYFYEKPLLEARWEDAEIDDRANFYTKSNLRSADDNENTILLKNYVDGQLKNIPDPLGITANGILANNTDEEQLKLKFYESKGKVVDLGATVTLTNDTAGIYKANVILESTVNNVYASWQNCDNIYQNLMLHFNSDSSAVPIDTSQHRMSALYLGNATLLEDAPAHFTNKSSVYFDASLTNSDSVDVTYLSDLFSVELTGQFTIDFWIKFDDTLGTTIGATQNKQYIFDSYATTNNNNLALYWMNTTEYPEQFYIETPLGSFAAFKLSDSPQSIEDNVWNYIAITRNVAGEVHLYFNGEPGPLVSITGLDTHTIDWDNKLRIGRSGKLYSADFPFKGYIDELRITKELLYTGDFQYSFQTNPPNEHSTSCTIYHEEYIKVKTREVGSEKPPTYVTAIQNLKNSYSKDESARFRIFTRLKDWSPTIYTIATKELRPEIVEKAYYRIVRVVDDFVVIDYGIENPAHTKLSYDKDGSYFDLDMSLFEPGWAYRIEFMYDINGELRQQPETFKFRVE